MKCYKRKNKKRRKKRRKEEEKHAEKKALNEKGKNHVGDAKVKEEINN